MGPPKLSKNQGALFKPDTLTRRRGQGPKDHHKAFCFTWTAQCLLKPPLPEGIMEVAMEENIRYHENPPHKVTHVNVTCRGLGFRDKEIHGDAELPHGTTE